MALLELSPARLIHEVMPKTWREYLVFGTNTVHRLSKKFFFNKKSSFLLFFLDFNPLIIKFLVGRAETLQKRQIANKRC